MTGPQDAATSDEQPAGPRGTRLEQHVSGGGSGYQAGRDLHIHDALGRLTRPGSGAADVVCPYPGLAPFDEQQKRWFHGRAQMVAAICERLDARLVEGGPLILIGPSGAGKSSLLAAGVLPALADGRLPVAGSRRWPQMLLTPTATPAVALAVAAGFDPEDARRTAKAWRSDPAGCLAELREKTTGASGSAGLVVVVDQFEEVFTACAEESERRWFIELLDALARPGARTAVVLGVRADFYAACTGYPQLRAALRAGSVLLDPMTETELREAIHRPARDAGLDIEDGLIDVLLADLGEDASTSGAGAAARLPLLAHALRATWQQRSGHTLTVDGYRDTGRIQNAVAKTAERLFDKLQPTEREAARWVFLRLVIVGQDTDDTRRRLRYEDLLRESPAPQQAAAVVDRFTTGRLLARDVDMVAITHEVLIRAWPRLREWIEQDRAGNLVRQDLEAAAAAWAAKPEPEPSVLYRGARLETASAWAEAHQTDLSTSAAAFLTAARRLQRRGRRIRRSAVAAITALALAASGGLVVSGVYQRRAERAQQRQLAQYLAASADTLRGYQPGLAKQLSLLAYRLDPQAGRDAVLNSQRTPGIIDEQQAGYDLAADSGGRITAISTGDGITLRGGSTESGGSSARIGGLRTGPIALTRDGALLAASDFAITSDAAVATLRLWSLQDPAHPRPTAAIKVASGISALAFSADGRTLYGGTQGGTVLRWDVSDPASLASLDALTVGSADVDSLAVAPQHNLLAATSGKTVRLWDTTNTAQPVVLTTSDSAGTNSEDTGNGENDETMGSPVALHRVAFDRTGSVMAVGGPRNVPVLWNIRDPHAPVPVPNADDKTSGGAASSVNCDSPHLEEIAFSPQANELAGRCGASWYLWTYLSAPDSKSVRLGARQENSVDSPNRAVMFDPRDPRRLLNATSLGVEVWDVSNPYQPGVAAFLPATTGDGAFVTGFTMGADGRRQLTAVDDGFTNHLWDTTNPTSAKLLLQTAAMQLAGGVALSADGRLLADGESCDGDGACVRLYDTEHPAQPLATISDAGNNPGEIAFSPTRPILVLAGGPSAANGGTTSVVVYDIADPRHPHQIAQLKAAGTTQLRFSPDGATLVAVDYAYSVIAQHDQQPMNIPEIRSWDMTDPSHPAVLWTRPTPPDNNANSIAFNPAGTLLADYGDKGTLYLWHVSRHQLLGDPVTVQVGNGFSTPDIAFSPDGSQLALPDTPTGDTYQSRVRTEIWDLADPNSPSLQFYLPLISTSVASAPDIAFTPGGTMLGTFRSGQGTEFWTIDPKDAAANLCTAIGDPITRQEWERYLPGRPYQPPCPGGDG